MGLALGVLQTRVGLAHP